MDTQEPAVQTILILDDDLNVTEGLAAGMQRQGRNIITCNDVESAELALECLTPTHVVADVHISGPFGFEGLEFVRYAKRQLPGTRTILITGDAPEALQLEASERGAVAFLKKPFDVAELESLIDLMTTVPVDREQGGRIIRMPLLDDILSGRDLHTTFEPIVRLGQTWTTFAYAAVTGLDTSSPLARRDLLYRYAARKQRIDDLEKACVANALDSISSIAEGDLLFMTIHPSLFTDGRALANLFIQQAEKDLRVDHIILEITEQEALRSGDDLFDTFERLREMGIRFALGDFGVSYSHLPLINRIRPSFLKIGPALAEGLERDLAKVRIVSNIASLARDFGCELILEGIEMAACAEAAWKLGVQFGQGTLFGRPLPVSVFPRARS